jgi:hypothetical protein
MTGTPGTANGHSIAVPALGMRADPDGTAVGHG